MNFTLSKKAVVLGGVILAIFTGFSPTASAASGLFLKNPPAAQAFVVDLSAGTYDTKGTALALQGLVNRTSAEVYVITRTTDLEQLVYSAKPYTVLPTVNDADITLQGLKTLFGKYHTSVKKMFIYDPAKDWTFNLALMAGAQQNGIPVTLAVRDALRAQIPSWAGTEEDYTNIGTNRVEGYEWALEHLMPNCTRRSVYVSGRYYMNVLDHVVSSTSFYFTLSVADPAQNKLAIRIFSTPGYGVGTYLAGYSGDEMNRLANPYGIGYNVDDHYSNGSFWISFPNNTYTQPSGKAITAEKGKVYVSIVLSDGDNLQFDQFALYNHWKDPARGTVPVGTALAPVLQEVNSPLLNWYYANKTPNDELIAGPCGFQFIYLDDFDANMLPEWCRINAKWIADAGFHTVSVWHGTFPSAKYDVYTGLSGVAGILHNFNRITNPQFSNGVPLIMERIRDCWTEKEIYEDLAGAVANPDQPKFVSGKLISAGFGNTIFTSIKTTVDRLNAEFPGKYVFQLPKDQAETAKAYYQQK